MASQPPRVTIAKPNRANGVLAIPASATQRKGGQQQELPMSKNAARLKIIIRRLPPGLTQVEFEEALGPDWKVGGGKVDWFIYKAGKLSKDPAKPSRPSRAYLHLVKQEHISLLAEKIRNATFEDAKSSSKDSALLGPPSVEFAPYGRVPNSRPRKDARQGTIDQDPEFIDFLESLTNPVTKPPPVDQENDGTGKSKEKVTTTPLVQFLKDKKANKGKENAAAAAKGKQHGRQDPKDSKASAIIDSKPATATTQISSPKKRSAQAVKVEQAARDAVKVLNKQAVSTNKTPSAPNQPPITPTPKSPVVPSNTTNAALADKKRERGSASVAAKILMRDLNLDRNPAGRGGRRGPGGNVGRSITSNTVPSTKQDGAAQTSSPSANPTATESAASNSNVPAPDAPPTTSATPSAQPPTGPAASRGVNAPNANFANSNQKSTPPPSTATQAFLKHANPSQGITEPLLEEAFVVFGTIKKVEIDKKKGFAYVEFEEPESLQKAIKASPIKVAQGQVVVLERKTGSNLQARNNMRGGPMMGVRGGQMPMGARGGLIRGRGGYGRGGANMPNANRHPSAAANAASQATAAGQSPATTRSAAGASAAPAINPAQAPSASSAPAD